MGHALKIHVRVDLGAIAMKCYSTLLIYLELEPHNKTHINVMHMVYFLGAVLTLCTYTASVLEARPTGHETQKDTSNPAYISQNSIHLSHHFISFYHLVSLNKLIKFKMKMIMPFFSKLITYQQM